MNCRRVKSCLFICRVRLTFRLVGKGRTINLPRQAETGAAGGKSQIRSSRSDVPTKSEAPKSEGNPKSSPGVARTKGPGEIAALFCAGRSSGGSSRLKSAHRAAPVSGGSAAAGGCRRRSADFSRLTASEGRLGSGEIRGPHPIPHSVRSLRETQAPVASVLRAVPMPESLAISALGFRISDFLRISAFGFWISFGFPFGESSCLDGGGCYCLASLI
jgi:hypothetical protein